MNLMESGYKGVEGPGLSSDTVFQYYFIVSWLYSYKFGGVTMG